MMRLGDYCRLASVTEAAALCARDGFVPFAGGTDLMVKARGRSQFQDKTFVDLGGMPELSFIREENETISVGAAVTLTQLLCSPIITEGVPLLWKAASRVANRQVRNRATLAGNVANACPASDCIPALMVLGASVIVTGAEGEREIPMETLFRSCEACLRHEGMQVRTCFFTETAVKKLTLRPGELITSVQIPKQEPEQRSVFEKLTENQSAGMAVLNFAMTGSLGADGTVTAFRVCPGGVFPRPRCFPEGENPLLGKRPDPALFRAVTREISDSLAAEKDTLADYAYKSRVLPNILQDGMAQLFSETPMLG